MFAIIISEQIKVITKNRQHYRHHLKVNMGTCASQDEAVLVKPPNSPHNKGGPTNSNSTDNSIKTTEREHSKTASNFSKQSYDTTTAGTTASKSIFNGPAGNNSLQNNKNKWMLFLKLFPRIIPVLNALRLLFLHLLLLLI